MRRSKSEIYLHLVWATGQRRPQITPHIERPIYRCIESEVKALGCQVLALNGVHDHVHLVVQTPTTICASELAKQIKGVSSAFINDNFPIEERFHWQENYAVFSVSRSHLKRVIAYVQKQKEHHAQNSTWPQWEETDEEIPRQNQ